MGVHHTTVKRLEQRYWNQKDQIGDLQKANKGFSEQSRRDRQALQETRQDLNFAQQELDRTQEELSKAKVKVREASKKANRSQCQATEERKRVTNLAAQVNQAEKKTQKIIQVGRNRLGEARQSRILEEERAFAAQVNQAKTQQQLQQANRRSKIAAVAAIAGPFLGGVATLLFQQAPKVGQKLISGLCSNTTSI